VELNTFGVTIADGLAVASTRILLLCDGRGTFALYLPRRLQVQGVSPLLSAQQEIDFFALVRGSLQTVELP
jgi:hypothetical protein